MRARLLLLLSLCAAASIPAASADKPGATTGVLLLAHGGRPLWNQTVEDIAAAVDRTYPTEVAMGMASKPAIVEALARLTARGATEVRAVPLFVSSHSSVITSTQYLLGLRTNAPPELALFARMRHGHGTGSHREHADHEAEPDVTPIASPVPVTMGSALDDHPLVAEILRTRALGISTNPAKEVLILVAHGPNDEDDNRRWLDAMAALVERMRPATGFARIEYQTVRDDAPEPTRAEATAELRARVDRATSEGRQTLVVPLLLSYGGIEAGIRKRLDGLTYVMSPALAPDPRLVDWVLAQVRTPAR